MKALSISRFENLIRRAALGGSAIAALIFGVGFANEQKIYYQIERFLTGQDEHLGLPIYLALLVTVFIGYLLAGKNKFAAIGSMLTIGAVGALYAWCQIGLRLSPGPYLIVLACPAFFYLCALLLQRQSHAREVVSLQQETASYPEDASNAA